MPTPLNGSPTKSGTFPASTTVAVTWPALLNTHSQALGVAFGNKSATPGVLTGWGAPAHTFTHSSGAGGLAIYRRKNTSGSTIAAGGDNITFSAATTADYVCDSIEGDFDVISGWSEQDGTSTVTSLTLNTPVADCRRIDYVTSANYPGPRVYPSNDGTITLEHQSTNSGPGITRGTKALVAGSTSHPGLVYVPDDPTQPVGAPAIDTTYAGEDWSVGGVVSLLYKPLGSSGSSGGTQSAVSGTPVIVAATTVTAPAAPAGGCRWVIALHNMQNAVVLNTPTAAGGHQPWVLKGSTLVDSYLHRLYVFVQDTPGAVTSTSTAFSFTGSGSPVTVLASGASTGPFKELQLDKYDFTRDPQSPSVTAESILGYALTFVGTGNFLRTFAPPASTFTEILELLSGSVALAVGKENVGTLGVYQPAQWDPIDPPPPTGTGGDEGDGFRVGTMLFGPAGATGGGTGPVDVAITGAGPLVYVAAPGNLRVRAGTLGYGSFIVDFDDLSTDETAFEVKVTHLLYGTVTTTSIAAGSTSFTVTPTDGLTPYEIRVYAVRSGDYSAPAILQVTTTAPPFQTVLTTGSDLTLALNEEATIILSTTPAQVGLAVTWSIDNAAILAFVGTPVATTNGSGQATAVVKGLGVTGPAIVTARIAGAFPRLLLNGSSVVESLVLTIAPSIIEDNTQTVAIVTGSNGGGSLIGKQVFIESSDPAIVAEPASSWIFDDGIGFGRARIPLTGVSEGSALIQAHTQALDSNVVGMTVQRPPVPVYYNASGVSMCVITAESPLARARRANPRRLTIRDHANRFPGDIGLHFADDVERSEYVFITAEQWAQR